MRAPVSIVIPTLNAEAELGPALGALAEGLAEGLVRELVVSDGGSQDGTRAMAEAAGAVWVAGAAGRGAQLARGARAAGGDWLLFLHADTRLGSGWARAVLEHIELCPDIAGHFQLRFRAAGFMPGLTAGWANLRSRAFGLPYGDQGLLIPRSLYDAVGGFADLPLMEDVALVRELGGRLAELPAFAETGAGRYQRNGWVRQGAGNLWRLIRYLGGTDPARLVRGYSSPEG